jgi:hypothetical protein
MSVKNLLAGVRGKAKTKIFTVFGELQVSFKHVQQRTEEAIDHINTFKC